MYLTCFCGLNFSLYVVSVVITVQVQYLQAVLNLNYRSNQLHFAKESCSINAWRRKIEHKILITYIAAIRTSKQAEVAFNVSSFFNMLMFQ